MENATLPQNFTASQVIYRGHVQGVGFRRTVFELAKAFRVAGFVRNLDDGGVELRAEGEHEELARFLGKVEERLSRNIASAQKSPGEPTGMSDFKIRY